MLKQEFLVHSEPVGTLFAPPPPPLFKKKDLNRFETGHFGTKVRFRRGKKHHFPKFLSIGKRDQVFLARFEPVATPMDPEIVLKRLVLNETRQLHSGTTILSESQSGRVSL